MSALGQPEQIKGDARHIDTSADVYVLGMLLYKTLTERLPSGDTGGFSNGVPSPAGLGLKKPSAFRKQINADVDAIVLKCLSHEREQRYHTAGDLQRDIAHYLAGEPVEVRRADFCYTARKLAVKHRAITTLAAALVAIILGGSAVTTKLWLHADAERHKEAVRHARGCVQADDPVHAFELLRREHDVAPDNRTAYAFWPLLRKYPLRYALPVGALDAVRYSPDGAWLATVSREGAVAVYEVRNGTEKATVPADSALARCLTFVSDGSRFYVGGKDGRIRAWNFDQRAGQPSREPTVALEVSAAPVTRLAISTDGRHLAAGSEAGTVVVWLVDEEGGFRQSHEWHGLKKIRGLTFSRDGTRLAASAEGVSSSDRPRPGGVWVWQLEDGALLGRVDADVCRGCVFSDDGERLFFGAKHLSVWNRATGDVVHLEDESRWGVRAVDVSRLHRDRFIAIAAGDGRVRFYDTQLKTLCDLQAFHNNDGPDHVDVCFSPTHPAFATASSDGLRVWDFPPGNDGDLMTPQGLYRAVAGDIGLDGNRVLVAAERQENAIAASDEGPGPEDHFCRCQLFLWERQVNQVVPLPGPLRAYDKAALSPSGCMIAASGDGPNSAELVVFGLSTAPSEIYRAELSQRLSALLWLNENPPALLLGFDDGSIKLCTARKTTNARVLRVEDTYTFYGEGRDFPTTCAHLTQSADGQWLGACWEGPQLSGAVTIWRSTGRSLSHHGFDSAYNLHHEFVTHRYTWSMAFVHTTAKDVTVATAGSSFDVRLWEGSSGREIGRLVGHYDVVRQCLPLRPGVLVTASDDRTLRIWDVEQREELCVLHESR